MANPTSNDLSVFGSSSPTDRFRKDIPTMTDQDVKYFQADQEQGRWDKGSEQQAAAASGSINGPIDIARYANLFKNLYWDQGMMKKSPEEMSKVYHTTQERYNNPAIFSDDINNYRQKLAQDHPVATSAGEVLGSGLFAAGTARKVISNFKKGKDVTTFADLYGRSSYSRMGLFGKEAAKSAVKEGAVEPVLNENLFK